MEGTIYSLIPPLAVILLVIFTKKIALSIGTGIVLSALMLSSFRPLAALRLIAHSFAMIFYDPADGWNTDNVLLIVFVLGLGALTALIEQSGGAAGFGRWAGRHVHTAAGAQLVAAALGILIFIDDYFNALTVGEVAKNLTDRQGVSREKLAYIIDCTSAPVCSICPISSWGAYIIALYAMLLPHTESPLMEFIRTIPYNFYPIFALLVMLLCAAMNVNIGRMKNAPPAPQQTPDSPHAAGRARDLIAPIAVLVAVSTACILFTGYQNAAHKDFLSVFSSASTNLSLCVGCAAALVWSSVRYFQLHRARGYLRAVGKGVRAISPATFILLIAWMLINLIDRMHVGVYISQQFVQAQIPVSLVPVLLFLVSSLMAFATGFSWGAFGIMLPIGIQMAKDLHLPPAMMYCCLAAVLSGSVFGDHCSPISDTTILSSTGAQCNHINHVVSQLPYAIFSALIAAVGFWIAGVTRSIWAAYGVQLALLVLWAIGVRVFRRVRAA